MVTWQLLSWLEVTYYRNTSQHDLLYARDTAPLNSEHGSRAVQYTVEAEIMEGWKYSTFAIWSCCKDLNITEMPFLKKSIKTTYTCDNDRNKTVSGLFIPRPFLLINTHTRGLMLTNPPRTCKYMYLKPIVIV